MPDTPWSLIIYEDEIAPGDALKVDLRKSHAIYWSFKEFGIEILCKEEVWFVACLARTSLVADLEAGTSHLFRFVLKFFFNPDGHNIALGGACLKLYGDNSATVMLFATLSVFISDEKALKDALLFKGASGLKICCLCKNITSHKSDLFDRADSFALPDTCIDVTQWEAHTDESIRRVVHRLSEASSTESAGDLDRMEKMLGWVHNAQGLLNDTFLTVLVVTILMYEWMHIYFVSGIWNVEVVKLINALQKCNASSWVNLDGYVNKWVWPKLLPSGRGIFGGGGKRHKKAKHVKCTASEGLGLYMVIASFLLHCVGAGGCEAEIASYMALCGVIDLLLEIAHGGVVSPAALYRAIYNHLSLYQAAYGSVDWIPKHHFSLHLPQMLRMFGCLYSCFVLERHHKLMKRFCKDRLNGLSFELGTLEDITLQQLHDLNDAALTLRDGLLRPHAPTKKVLKTLQEMYPNVAEIQVARVVSSGGVRMQTSDVVLADIEGSLRACELWFGVSLDGVFGACVVPWDRAHPLASDRANWSVRDEPRIVPLKNLRVGLIYSKSADGMSAMTLLPMVYR